MIAAMLSARLPKQPDNLQNLANNGFLPSEVISMSALRGGQYA